MFVDSDKITQTSFELSMYPGALLSVTWSAYVSVLFSWCSFKSYHIAEATWCHSVTLLFILGLVVMTAGKPRSLLASQPFLKGFILESCLYGITLRIKVSKILRYTRYTHISTVLKYRKCLLSLKWGAACRACDSGVKSSLELEMLCHCSRGSEWAQVSRVNERACFRVSVDVWCWW